MAEKNHAGAASVRSSDTDSSAARAPGLFAESLRALFDEAGIHTRAGWAKCLDVSQAALSLWTKGKNLPRPDNLQTILREIEGVESEIADRFRKVLEAPIESVVRNTSRVGDADTLHEYLMAAVEAEFLKRLRELPVADQDIVLNDAIAACDRVAHRMESKASAPGRTYRRIQRLLDNARAVVGASSACFYVRDPLMTDMLRLVAMPGVEYMEPMRGLLMPTTLRAARLQSQDERFYPNASSSDADNELRQPMTDVRFQDLEERNPLFGDFILREGLSATYRRQLARDGQMEALLFVNFELELDELDAAALHHLRILFQQLTGLLPELQRELASELRHGELGTLQIRLSEALFKKSKSKRPVKDGEKRRLAEALETILGSVLGAFDEFSAGQFTATIHTWSKGDSFLRLAAECVPEEVDRSEIAAIDKLDLARGQGLVSWSALRGRALVVNDVGPEGSSPFKTIREIYWKRALSELVVPMRVGERIVGVLSIESSAKDAFSDSLVRQVLWATQQMTRMWQKFLLDGVARSTGSSFGFERVEIWKYDPEKREFTNAGASYDQFEFAGYPRPDGWSSYIADNRKPVKLTILPGRRCVGKELVDGEWLPATGAGVPRRVNQSAEDVALEIGVPLMVGDYCQGVLWLKKINEEQVDRVPELVGYLDRAGRVIAAA